MPDVWPVLQKQGLDDLQIYRVWQVIISRLAAAGWLRKRPGKPSRPLEYQLRDHFDQWEELEDAKMWVKSILDEFPELKSKPAKKKDHISTTELIDQEARKQRQEHGDEDELTIPVFTRRQRRKGEW